MSEPIKYYESVWFDGQDCFARSANGEVTRFTNAKVLSHEIEIIPSDAVKVEQVSFVGKVVSDE